MATGTLKGKKTEIKTLPELLEFVASCSALLADVAEQEAARATWLYEMGDTMGAALNDLDALGIDIRKRLADTNAAAIAAGEAAAKTKGIVGTLENTAKDLARAAKEIKTLIEG
jgi:hypothetical protein